MERNQKYNNQNILDFVLSNYGSIEYIGQFLKDNNMDNILDFGDASFKSKYVIINDDSQVVLQYRKRGYIVSTGNSDDVLLPIGDFNNDFSNDFFI